MKIWKIPDGHLKRPPDTEGQRPCIPNKRKSLLGFPLVFARVLSKKEERYRPLPPSPACAGGGGFLCAAAAKVAAMRNNRPFSADFSVCRGYSVGTFAVRLPRSAAKGERDEGFIGGALGPGGPVYGGAFSAGGTQRVLVHPGTAAASVGPQTAGNGMPGRFCPFIKSIYNNCFLFLFFQFLFHFYLISFAFYYSHYCFQIGRAHV